MWSFNSLVHFWQLQFFILATPMLLKTVLLRVLKLLPMEEQW